MFIIIDTCLEDVVYKDKHIDNVLAYLSHIHKDLIEYAPYSKIRDSVNKYVIVYIGEDYMSSSIYQIKYGIEADISRTFNTSIKILNDKNEDCLEELYRIS